MHSHLPPRPVTKADAADALDRTDQLLDHLDDVLRRTLARFTNRGDHGTNLTRENT